jgi:predicted SAM-dependent methyltransferase
VTKATQIMADLSRLAWKTAKALVRQIPPINRLIRQRDELLREVEQLRRRSAVWQPQRPIHDRREVALRHLDLDGIGLEIGPGHSPLIPKSEGYRVETVDYAAADHLREKFRRDGVDDISRVEEVDYITGGGPIFDAIGKPDRYDYIVASHVVEHIPDLLGFLKDCERLLKPDGRLSLAVPDKRCCFDIFQGLTMTGEVLQAHYDRACRPSPAVLFDFVVNYAKRGDRIVWIVEDTAELHCPNSLESARALFEHGRSTDQYFDAHVWRFVPSSFRMIMSDLYSLGEISLREFSFVAPVGFEFFAVLSRDANGCPHDRLTLAKQALNEQAVVAFP